MDKQLEQGNGINLGSWNVRTLNTPGALQYVLDTVRSYKIQLLALQEVRWPNKGSGKYFDIAVISCYGPTEEKEDEKKDKFYEELEEVYDRLPRHSIKIFLGDFNAKIGRETMYRPTICKESLHEYSNDNGTRLINMAMSKKLVISSTYFPRKDIHKHTWVSPNELTKNQIDHVMISKKHMSYISNVKSYRGADADTDHYLIIANFRIRPSSKWKRSSKTNNSKFNVEILRLGMSEKFEVKSGLRQGDALSPMLFNIALEWVVRTANETRKMEVGEIETILAYADDVVILGNSRNEVKQTTIKFLEAGKIMGLEVNQEKTKYMCISRNDRNDLNLKVDPYIFEKVEAFKYLGININSKNNVHEEIKERVASANRCYYSLLKLFRSKLLSRESKVILYTSYLRPVLTYRCETWATTKGDYAKLCTIEKKVLRKIFGPVYNIETRTYERRHNNDLQNLYERPNILSYSRSKRIEWAGHVWRAEGKTIKRVTEGRIVGKRPVGRPRTKWKDVIVKDLKMIHDNVKMEDANDKARWSEIMVAAMDLHGPLSY
ncbi:hypothetical protein QTP88_004958 [Uroleucon formosanum]